MHRLLILAAALLFSTGGMAIKACGLTSWQVAGFRSGIAALALALVFPSSVRGVRLRHLPAALAYAATMVLFVLANKLTTAADTIFLQSTAPLYVLLLSPLLLEERARRREVGIMLLLALGLALFFVELPAPQTTAPDPFTGNLLATGAGIAWGLTLIGLRHAGREGSPLTPVVFGNLFAFLIAFPMTLPVHAATAMDWSVLVYLGLFQIGLAYLCLTRGLRAVKAFEASLLLLAEPALNPIWAWLVQGERPGPWALAGGALILGATAALALGRRSRVSGSFGPRP